MKLKNWLDKGGMSLFFEWSGRNDINAKGKRLHEVVQNVSNNNLQSVSERTFGIVGFESDEGVRRNKGRVGASKAPNEIRSLLANISYHSDNKNVIDIGNVTCVGHDLEGAQAQLGDKVASLIQHRYTPIILGGGHETFYGHYLGVRKALGADKKIGMINLDAHFDLRQDETSSSGTMFRQILESDSNANYLCLGIQELGNTEELFLTADQFNVEYVKAPDLLPLKRTFEIIDDFSNKQDVVIYTICTDVINQANAPGVSAPAPFGLDPKTVREITDHVVKQKAFLSFDVSEVNPKYDVDHKTARLISYILAETLTNLNKMHGHKEMREPK